MCLRVLTFKYRLLTQSSRVKADDDCVGSHNNLIYIVLLFLLTLIPDLTFANEQFSLTESSTDGQLDVTVDTQGSDIPFNQLHNWTVTLKDRSGKSVSAQDIIINGSMPRHNHGLPTRPYISEFQETGKYLIEGLRFQMPGVWQLQVKSLVNKHWYPVNFKLLVESGKVDTGNTLSNSEIAVLKSLQLTLDKALPKDVSNKVESSLAAAKLGQQIFFDPSFSRNQKISCATCHQPENYFADGKTKSKGLSEIERNAPSLIGVAHNEWWYWDGRRDSLWSQALTPFEAPQEMGFTRVEVLQNIAKTPGYSDAYKLLFGTLPEWIINNKYLIKRASPIGNNAATSAWKTIPSRDKRAINRAFANIGKAIAAYERKLLPVPALFDRYVDALMGQGKYEFSNIMTPQQLAGMKLFISAKTQCLNCHNGPFLTNQSFHNIGTGFNKQRIQDMGRLLGIQAVLLDQFNCLGLYSDAPRSSCEKLKYINRNEIGALMNGAFKVPSLRNLTYTAPYMHDGRFTTILEVLKHYQNPPDKTQTLHELSKLDLSEQDLENLAAFLQTLSAPMRISSEWHKSPSYQ